MAKKHEPSDSSGRPRWLEELEEQLGNRTDTVRQTLAEVAAILGPTMPNAFWSARGTGDDAEVTVFILASNILHLLDRRLDPEQEIREGQASRTCTLQTAPITKDAMYEVEVESRYGANLTRSTTRSWKFEIGRLGTLEFAFSDERAQGVNPTPFARALAAEINKARMAGGKA
jgi:hypothetical protein